MSSSGKSLIYDDPGGSRMIVYLARNWTVRLLMVQQKIDVIYTESF